MTRARAATGVFLLYFCAAVVMTWPLAQHPMRLLPSDLIDTLLNTWIIGWVADRLPHLLAGVWDAPIFFPYHNTLAFSENLFGLTIFVAPIYWVTHNPILTYNAAFIGSFAVAAIGMYLLVERLTGSRAAAIVAGGYYAFCPYRMSQIDHIQMIATGWMPIGLWGLHRYCESPRRLWLAVFVAAYVLQVTSNMYVAYVMAIPSAFIVGHGLLSHRSRWRSSARDLAAAGLAITVLLAPIAIPYYQARVGYRNVRNSVEIEMNSADVRDYVSPIDAVGVWRGLPGAVPLYGEKALFPGVFIILAAAIAVVQARRHPGPLRRHVVLYSLILLSALVISLGPHVRAWGVSLTDHGPYDWLWRAIPGWDGMRVPARFGVVVFLALAVIGGLGITILIDRFGRRGQAAAACAGLVIVMAEGWIVPMRTRSYSQSGRAEDRELTQWLSRRPIGGVLDMPMVTDNFEELHYQFGTLRHRHPLVNGMSGYNSGLQRLFRNMEGPLYDWDRPAAVVRMLRALGIRYVAIHPGDYTRGAHASGEQNHTIDLLRRSGQVTAEQELFGSHVFELLPPDLPASPPAGPAMDPRDFSVRVSGNDDRAAFLVDNDGDTRWFVEQNGDPSIEISFRTPTDIAAVGLGWAERSLTDYPRELTIESDDGQGTTTVLYKATPYAEAITAFVRNGFYPMMTIPLIEHRGVRLRIRQTGAVSGARWWSVHELKLWRR